MSGRRPGYTIASSSISGGITLICGGQHEEEKEESDEKLSFRYVFLIKVLDEYFYVYF